MNRSILIAAIALSGLSIQAQASNLIQNGSFETPAYSHGEFNYANGNAAPWTGNFQIQNGLGKSNAFCDQACPAGIDRGQFAVLQQYGPQYASQTFNTAKAPGLRVAWKDAGRTGYSPVDSYSVFFDGVLAGNYIAGEGAFSDRSLFFANIAAGAHTLRFEVTGDPDDDGISPFIDKVSAAAVPEPASWAMLITGFGLTGATLRRRRVVAITA